MLESEVCFVVSLLLLHVIVSSSHYDVTGLTISKKMIDYGLEI